MRVASLPGARAPLLLMLVALALALAPGALAASVRGAARGEKGALGVASEAVVEPALVLLQTEEATQVCMSAPPTVTVQVTPNREQASPVFSEPDPDPLPHDGSAPGDERRRRLSSPVCCQGMLCRYRGGNCCNSSPYCCPADHVCTDDVPPRCRNASLNVYGPVRMVVQSVTPVTPQAPQRPAPPREAGDGVKWPSLDDALPGESSETSSEQSQPATPQAPDPRRVDTSLQILDPNDVGEAILRGESPEGAAWPPMGAFVPDGSAGVFVKEEQRVWTNNGLIRNGTTNKVKNETDCIAQCEDLQECRVALYLRTDGQCWLDSEVSRVPATCPVVLGRRNCVSYVKRVTPRDIALEYGETTVDEANWQIFDQQNWNVVSEDVRVQGGRLLRNGLRNIVMTETACREQCARLKYCRVAIYMRKTAECWLSSKVATSGAPCALRGRVRDCISFVKKRTSSSSSQQQRRRQRQGSQRPGDLDIDLPTA